MSTPTLHRFPRGAGITEVVGVYDDGHRFDNSVLTQVTDEEASTLELEITETDDLHVMRLVTPGGVTVAHSVKAKPPSGPCADCSRPLVWVAGRWVHVAGTVIGGGARPRPTFVYCPKTGKEARPA